MYVVLLKKLLIPQFQKDIGEKLAAVRAAGARVVIGYKGIENGHECFSAFRYTETSGKERFGGDFEESEWCDCYALESANLGKDIDAQPDVMSVFGKKSVKVWVEMGRKEKLMDRTCQQMSWQRKAADSLLPDLLLISVCWTVL